jgi:hypothetical protein
MLQSSKNYQAFAVVDDFAILRGYSWTYIGTKSLKVHKIENFFDSDFGICVISLIVMSKY